MRRAVGHIEKRGKGRYKVTVTCGRDPITGKKHRVSRTITGTATDAEALIPLLAAQAGKPVQGGARLTLHAYSRMWLADLDVRENTRNDYEHTMRLHVLPHLGAVTLDGLKPYAVRQWLKRLPTDHLRAKAFRVLRAALNDAVKPYELLERSPLASVETPKVPPRDLATLTPEEATAYLALFAGHRFELAVMLALTCGLRRSEIAALDRQSLRGGVIEIRRGLHESKGGGSHFEAPKSRRSRREVRPPGFVIDKWPKGFGALFPSAEGYTSPDVITRSYERHIRPTVDGKKVERVRYIPLRDLRHSAASLLLSQGLSMEEVRDILGHEDIRTTQTFYDKTKRSASARGAAIMQGLFGGPEGASGADSAGTGGDA